MPTVANPDVAEDLLFRHNLRDRAVADYHNYSLMMNKSKRLLLVSACNIDQNTPGTGKYRSRWKTDGRIGEANQLENEYYADFDVDGGFKVENPYDRGHMVMRKNAMWGDDPVKAAEDTYYYSNAAPQHKNLNKSEWKALETDIVGDLRLDSNGRLCVFTGPIWGPLDRLIRSKNKKNTTVAQVPSGFFKVICFELAKPIGGSSVGVLTFAIFQDQTVLSKIKGGQIVKTDQRYQIPVTLLERLTGLRFADHIRDRNPMIFSETTRDQQNLTVMSVPEQVPIGAPSDIIWELTEPRTPQQPLEQRPVAISAAMIRPGRKHGEPKPEHVTLLNRTTDDLDLSGWSLRDHKGRIVQISGPILVGGNFTLRGAALRPIALNDNGGGLMLFDDEDRLVDHVTWNLAAVKRVPEGKAYQFEVGQ